MRLIYTLLVSILFVSCYKGIDDTNKPSPSTPPETENYSLKFPDDFTSSTLENILGSEITISNPLYVTQTYSGTKLEGDITLSSEIHRSFTDVNIPSAIEYPKWVDKHRADRLILRTNYSLIDSDNTLRIGTKFESLTGIISYTTKGYTLALTKAPKIEHNSRVGVPTVNDYNLKVMSFNLENYYMYGNLEDAKSKRHHAKVISALVDAAADVYALCEIGKGEFTINYLCNQLNEHFNSDIYAALYKHGESNGSLVSCAFIYDKRKVEPHRDIQYYSFDNLTNRYAAQCFQLKSNSAKVILTMSHFKSKGGNNAYGENVDKNDGQSQFNPRRVKEAEMSLDAFESLKSYYADNDILILGDLNSYSMEDPIKVFTSAGYTNMLMKYSPDDWSYSYRGEVGYIDHSLSSSTLTSQVVYASPWDINASEPILYRYNYSTYFANNPYGSSDHNPIITWMNLK